MANGQLNYLPVVTPMAPPRYPVRAPQERGFANSEPHELFPGGVCARCDTAELAPSRPYTQVLGGEAIFVIL